jgi:hypothetical protein
MLDLAADVLADGRELLGRGGDGLNIGRGLLGRGGDYGALRLPKLGGRRHLLHSTLHIGESVDEMVDRRLDVGLEIGGHLHLLGDRHHRHHAAAIDALLVDSGGESEIDQLVGQRQAAVPGQPAGIGKPSGELAADRREELDDLPPDDAIGDAGQAARDSLQQRTGGMIDVGDLESLRRVAPHQRDRHRVYHHHRRLVPRLELDILPLKLPNAPR